MKKETITFSIKVLFMLTIFVGISFSDKLAELRKWKVELEEMNQKCSELFEPEKSKCMSKRQKEVEKYKKALIEYKEENQKIKKDYLASKKEGDASDLQTRIEGRERALNEFRSFVTGCDSENKNVRCAHALFQVAQLTFLNEEDRFLIKQQKYEKDYQNWLDRDQRGPEPNPPKRDHTGSLQYFQKFLQQYPKHKDAPAALTRAAYIADLTGQEDRSFEYLNLLVTRFPDHGLAIPSHLRLGEYWLLNRKYAKAISHYEKVPLTYGGKEADMALYHRAEAYYNMADFETAAMYYFKYVDLSDKGKLQGDLRDEAMEFMAACWADMDNGFEVAADFLANNGNPSWSDSMFYYIGDKNKKHDRLNEAVKAFQYLLDRNPVFPLAPLADLAIVEIYVIQKEAEKAQEARIAAVERYKPGSAWHKANKSNKKAVDDAEKAIKVAMYQIPVYYHVQGDKNKDKQLLQKATEHYNKYLSRYGSEESWDTYHVHQNLAIVYQKLGQFGKAAAEYDWCATAPVKKFGKKPPEKKDLIATSDAAYNVVYNLDKNRVKAVKKADGDNEKAYNAPETRAYFEAVQKFMKNYGQAESAPDIAYNAAFVHYEAKHYKEAIASLREVLSDFPDHKHSLLIKRALGQSLLEDGQHEEAEKVFRVLVRQWDEKDKEFPEIKKSLAFSIYKQADVKSNNNEHRQAAQNYLKVASDFRESDVADQALFEAGVNFDKAGDQRRAADALLRIYKEHPKSELKVKAILKAANFYMAKEMFSDAAKTFLEVQIAAPKDSMAFLGIGWAAEAYEKGKEPLLAGNTYIRAHQQYPEHPKTPSYMYNAGQIYEEAKYFDQALKPYEILVKDYPKSSFAVEAAFSIPLIHEKRNNYAKAAADYEEFVKLYPGETDKVVRSHLGAGKSFEKIRKEKEAMENYARTVDVYEKRGAENNVSPALPAEAAYSAGQIIFDDLKNIRLNGSKRENTKLAKKMQTDVAEAVKHFAKAAEMAEQEWTLKANLRLGDLFKTLAYISNNERIHAKNADERIAEKIGIIQGLPAWYDRGRELYQKNLELSRDNNVEDDIIDSTQFRFMEMYWLKGQAFEDVGRILSSAPIPPGLEPDQRQQYKAALDDKAFQAMQAAKPIYQEALEAAQYFRIDNPVTVKIKNRLREIDPEAPQLNLEPAPPQVAGAEAEGGNSPSGQDNFNDPVYNSNMNRIEEIYNNPELSEKQKIELYEKMESAAEDEIKKLESELQENPEN